ncbi:MAG TPA: hypothetical protein V6C85_31895 [Allocoleopsis sp.]
MQFQYGTAYNAIARQEAGETPVPQEGLNGLFLSCHLSEDRLV